MTLGITSSAKAEHKRILDCIETSWEKLIEDLSPFGSTYIFYGVLHVPFLYNKCDELIRHFLYKTNYPDSYFKEISLCDILNDN